MSLQIANIIGNATKDAELKSSKDGASYMTFRVAVSGNEDKATFYNIIVFGHYGEALLDHIKKGREVFVTGRLQITEKGYVSIVADHIKLLRWPKKEEKEQKVEPKTVENSKKNKKN